MRKNAYTEKDIARVNELRAAGKSWAEVGNAIGRSPRALYLKFRKEKIAKKQKRKYVLRKKVEAALATPMPSQTNKPMIALVGSPSEVTATIRELFS